VKAGMSQYLSLELLKSNTRDARSLHKIFPWLYYGPNEIQTIGYIFLFFFITLIITKTNLLFIL